MLPTLCSEISSDGKQLFVGQGTKQGRHSGEKITKESCRSVCIVSIQLSEAWPHNRKEREMGIGKTLFPEFGSFVGSCSAVHGTLPVANPRCHLCNGTSALLASEENTS